MAAEQRTAVFAYGSFVSRESAAATLGHDPGPLLPARLAGWRRRFSLARDNRECEKTFARRGDGWIPETILALNIERLPRPEAEGDGIDPVNGALIELVGADLERLAARELRYLPERIEGAVLTSEGHPFERILGFSARPENHAPTPPTGAAILRSYVAAVDGAFDGLGSAELAMYRHTTPLPEVELIDGELVADRIPPGNPRGW